MFDFSWYVCEISGKVKFPVVKEDLLCRRVMISWTSFSPTRLAERAGCLISGAIVIIARSVVLSVDCLPSKGHKKINVVCFLSNHYTYGLLELFVLVTSPKDQLPLDQADS